jgi:hypothetical protein
MAKTDINISLIEVYKTIADICARKITEKIINLFLKYGLPYKIKIGYGNVYRVFCYIKKSKEALIINSIGKNFGPFELQIRIKKRETIDKIESFSSNIKNQILMSKDCKIPFCCNSDYQFTYRGNFYRKCHMLCDNFTFRNLKYHDFDSIITIIQDEIIYDIPKTKRVYCKL